jgi:hypothetical protein
MQPMVVLEAAFCGLRTIGTPVGLLPDLAPALTTVIPHNDPHALAASLLAFQPTARVRATAITPEYLATSTAASLLSLYQAQEARPPTGRHTPLNHLS